MTIYGREAATSIGKDIFLTLFQSIGGALCESPEISGSLMIPISSHPSIMGNLFHPLEIDPKAISI